MSTVLDGTFAIFRVHQDETVLGRGKQIEKHNIHSITYIYFLTTDAKKEEQTEKMPPLKPITQAAIIKDASPPIFE